jgi:hypothetical protein
LESAVAKKIPTVSGAIGIAAGSKHSFILLGNGSVLAFGKSTKGQLGTGSTAFANITPALVSGLSGVVAVSGGVEHSLFLTASGAVYGCGNNGNFRIGLPVDGAQYNTPTLVTAAGACTAIAAGSNCSFVVGAGGLVKAIGMGTVLGLGYSTQQAAIFTQLPNIFLTSSYTNYRFHLNSAGAGLEMLITSSNATTLYSNPVGPLYYANVYSFDPVSGGPLPGQVNWYGLYVSPEQLNAHVALANAGCDMVFGPLDPSGGATALMPLPVGALSGLTIRGVSMAIVPSTGLPRDVSGVTSLTF